MKGWSVNHANIILNAHTPFNQVPKYNSKHLTNVY